MIQWSYENSKFSIFCNDIIVPSFKEPKFPINSVFSRNPSVCIEDTHGNLPLKLDRNNLETRRLPFEKDLITDISKDLILNSAINYPV